MCCRYGRFGMSALYQRGNRLTTMIEMVIRPHSSPFIVRHTPHGSPASPSRFLRPLPRSRLVAVKPAPIGKGESLARLNMSAKLDNLAVLQPQLRQQLKFLELFR